MTLKDIMKISRLAPNETELLLAVILKKRRETISAHPEKKISIIKYRQFKKLEKKRLQNWPLAYLSKQASFYKLAFIVNRKVLIPRPETELLLEQALTIISADKEKKTIIDVGTGSGAIIISLAKELEENNPFLFKNTQFIAIDISKAALIVAQQNINKYQLEEKIKVYHSDLLTKIDKQQFIDKNVVITANLPYLTAEQITAFPSIKQEPKIALDGGKNGLDCYQQLFQQLSKLEYKKLTCLCELDPQQKQELEAIIKQQLINPQLKFYTDLKNNTRLVVVRLKN